MELSTSEQIRTILRRKKMTVGALADLLGQSRQNFSNKLSRDNFSVTELKSIAKVLEIGYESKFILPNGEKI